MTSNLFASTYAAPAGSTAHPAAELPITESEAGAIAGLSAHELKRRRLARVADRPAHIQIGRRVLYLPSVVAEWRDRHAVEPAAA